MWQIYISESNRSDFNTERIAEISYEATSPSLSLQLNRGGTFSFTLPMNNDWVNDLNPVEHCIIVQRNDTVIWSGMVWTKDESFNDGKVNVSCVGWQEILHKRLYAVDGPYYNNTPKAKLTYTGNMGTLIQNLVTAANENFDTGISVVGGSNTCHQNIANYVVEVFANIGDTIIQLSEIESGPDLTIDPATKELNIKDSSQFVRSDVVFGFNTATANVKAFNRTYDASTMANQYFILGAIAPGQAHTPNAVILATENMLLQDQISLTDIGDEFILGAISNAELAVNQHPRVLYNFTPINTDNAVLFDDYNIGDQVTISATRDQLQVMDQDVRVFAAQIDLDPNGNEMVNSIQTTYQSGG